MVKVGQRIEDFELKDQNGKVFRLSEHKGRKVLLSFHPLAWTPVCRDQMVSLEKNYDEFLYKGCIPVGISVDSTFCKKAWAEAIGVRRLRMLSDFWPHGGLAQRFGLFRDQEGFSERANVLLDEEGKVLWVKVYPIREVPPLDEIFGLL